MLALTAQSCTSEKKLISQYSAQYKWMIFDGNMSSIYYTNEIINEGGAIRFIDHMGVERVCSEYTLEKSQ
jgi:hypothetical protein